MAHVVIVPLVVATQQDGSAVYLYHGVPVPDSVGKDEVARLVEGGFIAEEKVAAKFPEGDPAAEWKVAELKAYADAHAVDLGDAKSKDEILAVLAQ